ncbi:hypothetical protein PAMA_004575 [Pampus argenteus]
MKLNVLLWIVALFAAFLPHSADSRPADAPPGRLLFLPQPLLLRLGEEFSLRLDGGRPFSSAAAPVLLSPSSYSSSAMALLQLTQRLLQSRPEQQQEEVVEEAKEKEKRFDEPPISLDLTFHLLREVLDMARAEQIAQQADSNRKMMDSFGK